MYRKIALLFAVTTLFTVTACDTEETVEDDRSAEVDAPEGDVADRAEGDHEGRHGRHGKFNPAEKLCAELECTAEQATQIDALFAGHRDERHESRKADHEGGESKRSEANAAIAAAFRAEEFDLAVLERFAPENHGPEHGSERADAMVELAAELHAILTPAQRAELADKIAAGGPMMFGGHGKRGGHGEHGKKGDKANRDPAEKLAAKVEKFCAPISCTAEQQTQLTATFQGAHEARRAAHESRGENKPDFGPAAELFRADTLDQAKLRAALTDGKQDMHAKMAEHGKEFGAVIAEIHDILTPEQRGILADKIEAEGLHSLMGKGDHGKRGKGAKGKGKGKRGGDVPA